MSSKLIESYRSTLFAAFTDYIVQAIACQFAPLLFVLFQTRYGVSLAQLSLLVTVTFSLQILCDLLIPSLLKKIGIRTGILLANAFSAIGLILLPLLANSFRTPFYGILIAAFFYSLGAAFIEVMVSPIVEACPSPNHTRLMSLLHSFFNWGLAGVILLSTLFFVLFGEDHWEWLSLFWALIPIADGIAFLKVPIFQLEADKTGSGLSARELLKQKVFIRTLVLMTAAGAAELAISQWASALAENGLGVPKTQGDLLGPLLFALLSGFGRLFYAQIGENISIRKYMLVCSGICIAGYLAVVFSPWPLGSLLGCGLCGLGVGILWPGTLSMGSKLLPRGGVLMFSFLACAGDIGCTVGPSLVGFVADRCGGRLETGILAALIFPCASLAAIWMLPDTGSRNRRKASKR